MSMPSPPTSSVRDGWNASEKLWSITEGSARPVAGRVLAQKSGVGQTSIRHYRLKHDPALEGPSPTR